MLPSQSLSKGQPILLNPSGSLVARKTDKSIKSWDRFLIWSIPNISQKNEKKVIPSDSSDSKRPLSELQMDCKRHRSQCWRHLHGCHSNCSPCEVSVSGLRVSCSPYASAEILERMSSMFKSRECGSSRKTPRSTQPMQTLSLDGEMPFHVFRSRKMVGWSPRTMNRKGKTVATLPNMVGQSSS